AQPNGVVLHLGRMRARTSLVGRDRRTAFELNDEIVQRTSDALVVDDALRQRSALVRTAIVQRENLVIGGPKYRNIAGRRPHDARAENGNIVQRPDFNPVAHTSSSSASGVNSLRSTPRLARAAQGSLCENCCEWAKRLNRALRLATSS